MLCVWRKKTIFATCNKNKTIVFIKSKTKEDNEEFKVYRNCAQRSIGVFGM